MLSLVSPVNILNVCYKIKKINKIYTVKVFILIFSKFKFCYIPPSSTSLFNYKYLKRKSYLLCVYNENYTIVLRELITCVLHHKIDNKLKIHLNLKTRCTLLIFQSYSDLLYL